MNVPFWIATRYLRTRRHSGFITLLTGISIAGVALGVTALLTVLAVMNGFENEIQTRIAGTDAHVVLLGESTAGVRDADALVGAGAAVVVPDAECDAARLDAELRELLADPGRLEAMSTNARTLGRPDAAARLADLVEEVAREE